MHTKRGWRGKRVHLQYRPYSHPNPSKAIFSNKIPISKRFVFWADKYFSLIFFSFQICVTRSFRNRQNISHNTKSKIWLQLSDVTLPAKNVKTGKIKIMKFCEMTSSIPLQKSRVIALKLNTLLEIWISHLLLLLLLLPRITHLLLNEDSRERVLGN